MKRIEVGEMVATLAAFRDACSQEQLFRCHYCQDTGFIEAHAHYRGRTAAGVEPCWTCGVGQRTRATWWAELGKPKQPKPEAARKGSR